MALKKLAPILVLAFAVSARAQSATTEIRAVGEHRMVSGDTPDSAKRLALADARRQAWQVGVSRLRNRAEVKALQLTPIQLAAYAAAILETEENPTRTGSANGSYRVDVYSRLDLTSTVRRMAELRKDQDVTYELIDAWTQIERLHQQLADQTRRRAIAREHEADTILGEQLHTVVALSVKLLCARAYAAIARTEPTTVGGRAISAAGRERAKQYADAALALSPESPDAHYLLGDLWVEAEQPGAAEGEYRRALEGGAASSLGRTKLAAALRYQGKLPEAVAELREAQRIDPTFARAHGDLGMILRAQRNLPDAIAAYREAIRLDPDSTEAHNGLAVTLANSGQLEDAVAEFREIVRIDPDSTIGYYNLAYALAELDRDVESAAALREVIRINPNHYNARYNLGELFRLEGKFDDSATQFREYLRLAPDTPQNRRNITRAKGFIQQFEDPNAPAVTDTMRPR